MLDLQYVLPPCPSQSTIPRSNRPPGVSAKSLACKSRSPTGSKPGFVMRNRKFLFFIGNKANGKRCRTSLPKQVSTRNASSRSTAVSPNKIFRNSSDDLPRREPDTRNMLWRTSANWGRSILFSASPTRSAAPEAGEVLQDYCLAPSQETDAIICPSRAVQSAIRAFWNNYGDYLRAFRRDLPLPRAIADHPARHRQRKIRSNHAGQTRRAKKKTWR